MKYGFSRIFAAACLAALFAARSPAEDTNSIPALPAPDALNGYLQIQAQLHDTQMALEKSREEARQSAADTDARIQSLEQTLATQRASELEAAQKNQQSMFMMAGAFGLTVLAAVLFMVYLQWRAVTRLVEMSGPRAAGLLPGNGRGAVSLVTGAAVADANTRLFGAVDHLQKRILELEQGSRAALAEVDSAIASGQKQETPSANGSKRNGHGDRIADMIADAQTLLNANQPEKALRLFDEALAIDPKHADALIKKGGALEKLERFNEAVACYDRAIAANGSATIAYLQKGGLFNRLARYDEALKCYEQALQAQEKKSAPSVS
jgi:tetratricopeptide (TPR) repeat protein